MKKILLLAGIAVIAVIGTGTAKSNERNINTASAAKQSVNSGEAVALNVVNTYINLKEGTDIDKWMETQPFTARFKDIYRKQKEAVELADKRLSGRTLNDREKEIVEKYYVDYGPVFGAAWLDFQDDSVFALKSYDPKTGDIILKDKKSEIELPVKVVKKNGKWLIDGMGTVNIPE